MRSRQDTVILCYHAVSDTWPVGMSIRPASMEWQVSWMLRRGYRPATFYEAVTAPPARKTFAVTFDDAYVSVLNRGLPILERLGVPATVFPSTYAAEPPARALIGPDLKQFLGGPHEPDLVAMTWDQLLYLQDRGWEIGSHTVGHPLLTRVDDERLEMELRTSKELLEQHLGRPCRTIAYPSSDYDARVIEFTRRAGYEVGGTLSVSFPKRPDPLEYPRISVQRDDSRTTFVLKVLPLTRWARTTRGWGTLDRIRRRVLGKRPADDRR